VHHPIYVICKFKYLTIIKKKWMNYFSLLIQYLICNDILKQNPRRGLKKNRNQRYLKGLKLIC